MMMEKTKEYRKELAELFLRVLEEKNLDWKKEWRGKGVPVNAKRNVSYKGINRFRLMIVAMQRGYGIPGGRPSIRSRIWDVG